MKTFGLLEHVFVNRGHDTVQRGRIHSVTTKIEHVKTEDSLEGSIHSTVTTSYEVRFPYPAPSRFSMDDDDSPPFSGLSKFSESEVYATLQEAFEQKRVT